MPGGKQARIRQASGARQMAVAPDLFIPLHHLPVRIEAGFHLHGHRRSEGLPAKFIFAHPLQANGASLNRTRQQYRVERRVIRAVMAVTTRTFGMPHHNRCRIHFEDLRQLGAQRKNRLTVRPHLQPSLAPPGQRTRRTNRGMRQIGAREG